MLAKATAHVDASTFLLIAATVLFLLACPHKLGAAIKGWFLPLGLACFAASFWLIVFID